MIYPEFPKEGSVIGVCAPSAGVGGKLEYYDMSIEVLLDEGYDVYETESVRNDDCPSAPAEVRGAEFNSLFADNDIDMIFSASGGDYCVEMLPYIDEQIVRSYPKWFAGYSDPTAIQMFLTTVCDIATIYGVNAGAFDWRPLHEFQFDALSVLKGELPLQHSYDYYCSGGFDEETGAYEMDTPVEWILLRGGPAEDAEYEEFDANDGSDGFDEGCAFGGDERDELGDDNNELSVYVEDAVNNGSDSEFWSARYELHEESRLDVTGRLIGGCIDVIDWMIGTPYEDLSGFVERYKDDGFIWFFDNFELTPMGLMYVTAKMKMMGLFDDAKAVVFGRTCFTGDATDVDYLEQLERVFADMDLPIIWNADIGHTKPSFTLINGAIGHLEYEDGYAEMTMSLE